MKSFFRKFLIWVALFAATAFGTGATFVNQYRFGSAAPAGTPPTLVANISQGGGAGGVITSSINTLTANYIFVAAAWWSGGSGETLTDAYGNTWTQLTSLTAGSGVKTGTWYCYNPIVGLTHSFEIAGASLYGSIAVEAWSGVAASPFDGQNGATASTTTTVASGSVTPSQSGSLMISAVGFDDNSGGAITAPSGFTIPSGGTVAFQTGGYYGISIAHKIVSDGSATSATWTSASSMPTSAAKIAAFKY